MPCSTCALAIPAPRALGVAIEGGALVRILPVAQVLQLLVAQRQGAGEWRARGVRVSCRQIRGHHGVVGGGVGEGLGGQARARGELAPAPVRVELREQRAVVGRVHDHQHGGVVLGRGAQHGGSADVDVLDRLLVAAARTGDGGGEGVEVHHQQVDGRNAVLGHDGIIDAAAAEQSPVDLRVQRLDAPVHDLREAGVARDLGGGDALRREQSGGAAGGQDLDLALHERRAPAR